MLGSSRLQLLMFFAIMVALYATNGLLTRRRE